ncbi:hypothetical protein SCWH03_46290 [Streptomyces pacificus]|uniref:Uncharacterized protein n=1 Tax=Streptomyces pacificus TaxID=2705029 RepID=A0A6A0B3L6_9ACTN|nr:hypothetical protein SCWH03_46290 [Streptomyces pacificus]
MSAGQRQPPARGGPHARGPSRFAALPLPRLRCVSAESQPTLPDQATDRTSARSAAVRQHNAVHKRRPGPDKTDRRGVTLM